MHFDNSVQFIQASITNCENRFVNKGCNNFRDITYVRNYIKYFLVNGIGAVGRNILFKSIVGFLLNSFFNLLLIFRKIKFNGYPISKSNLIQYSILFS